MPATLGHGIALRLTSLNVAIFHEKFTFTCLQETATLPFWLEPLPVNNFSVGSYVALCIITKPRKPSVINL